MAKIFDINNIPEEMLPLVGGKARGLNSLIKYGFPVPEAFIVTDINDSDDPSPLAEKYLESGFGLVSVRSSATLEDGKDFSAAGQFSTFLNVEGSSAVLDAARACVASLDNETALQYSKIFLRSEDSRMTVIVQKMVKAKCAGVIFSRAPMRSGYVLVEAVPGLGENLVSGKMSAQQYRVRGEQIEEMPLNPVLTREQAIELGAAGKKAEKLFGQPMDLEWAIDENNDIWWLQARPITIGESVTMNELDCELDATDTVYTTGNIGEVMPGAVTPLTLSTNVFSLDWGVKKTYRDIGCFTEDIPPYSFIASYYNHLFFNMTSMYAIGHSVLGSTKETMDVSICGKILEGLPDTDMPHKPMLRKIRNTFPFVKLVLGGERARKGMQGVVDTLHFNLDDDIKGLYAQILDNFKYMEMAHYFHYGASYYSGGASAMLTTMLDKDFPDKDDLASAVAGCLTQIDDFESANILRSMKSLAEMMVREEPSLSAASVAEIGEYFDKRAGASVKEACEDFMKRHGYRGILENELRSLPWRDNRESFYTSMRSVLASAGKENQNPETPWTVHVDALLSKYGTTKRKTLMSSIKKARKGVCYREFTKSKVIYVVDQFKQAYRKLAGLMTSAGLLPDADCIYFLTQEEIGQLIDGNRSLVKKAIARRRLFPQQQELRFPFAAIGIPVPISASQTDPDCKSFRGTPVSRGIATGRARVVKSEEDAGRLLKGEIMIAACTDIGWSPYYSIIGGLVTEIGSALSHGVVVAREYALPTVVNVDNALNLIHTGDIVTIDGNTGSVVINKSESI